MVDSTITSGLAQHGDFRIGQVLSKAFSVFFKNIVTFSLISGIVGIPIVLFNLFAEQAPPDQKLIYSLLAFVTYLFFGPLSAAIILHGAFQQMRGLPVRLGESISSGLARLLPLLGLMILQTIGIMLGTLLFIIPGLILMVMWYVAIPVCVVERQGPVKSLGRSRELTQGFRWKIVALAILAALIGMAGAAILSLSALILPESLIQFVIHLIWQAVAGAFGAVLIVVAYYYLRVAKEGIDLEQIANVFD